MRPTASKKGLIAYLAILLVVAGLILHFAPAERAAWAQAGRRAGNAERERDPEADAQEPAATNVKSKNLLAIVRAGGPLMIPIIFCSFLLFVFTFERTIALRRGRVIPGPFVKRFLHQLRQGQLSRDEALELCEENGSPVAQVFVAALKKWNRPTAEVEQAILDSGERAANGLRKYVRVFNAVATLGPLLGLLGTVFGMIHSFDRIAASNAMGKPELLAEGISEALITTAAGLSVAIPALTAYLFFVGRVDQLIISIDELGQEITEVIASDGGHAASRSVSKARKEAAA